MKKWLFGMLVAALIVGCSNESSLFKWQQDNTALTNAASVEMKSTLWVNQMPMLGEVQEKRLHGALYITAKHELPATLNVSLLLLKQGEKEWKVDTQFLDLRTYSKHQWEVVFSWPLELDIEQSVDVAMQLENMKKQVWLVENNIKIEKVF